MSSFASAACAGPSTHFESSVAAKPCASVERRAKYILIRFDTAP
jgi:hypothetical protein